MRKNRWGCFKLMFENRKQVGELLASDLKKKGYGGKNSVILAIPRGGVVTGRAIAKGLNCPLDIIVTYKIPAPNQPELAVGSVGPDNVRVIDIDLAKRAGADENYLKDKIKELKWQIKEREEKFRKGRIPISLIGKIVIIVDDGIATGATIEAAIRGVRAKNPQNIVLAVPVASRDAVDKLGDLVDDMIILEAPEKFMAVGQFYRDFPQVSDEEVVKILEKQ